MKAPFKKRIGRASLILVAGFLVLFIFRFVYGYTTGASEVQEEYISDFFSDLADVKRNYASDSYKYQKSEAPIAAQASVSGGAQEFNVNQKYEKTATIRSRSTSFEDDEKALRNKIKAENAIIQYEQNAGRKGNRSVHLLIGIPPEKFDAFYDELLRIGKVRTKEITKVDKTNEFQNLNAKKISLETTRQSLLEIKKQNGKIEEFINLQNRILEIEQELQSLGVLLGDFDEEHEFCTVRFSLAETHIVQISLLHRLKVAFEWAIQYYLMFICIVAVGVFSAFFLLLIIDKVIPSIVNRVNQ
jgi:hypothetical protein